MTGLEPISRGATSQHFTIKLQPPLPPKKNNQSDIYNYYIKKLWWRLDSNQRNFKLWAWRDNHFSTPPMHPPGFEPRTFGFEDHCSIRWAMGAQYNLSRLLNKKATKKCYLPISTSTSTKHNFHKTRAKRVSVVLCTCSDASLIPSKLSFM